MFTVIVSLSLPQLLRHIIVFSCVWLLLFLLFFCFACLLPLFCVLMQNFSISWFSSVAVHLNSHALQLHLKDAKMY